jgi:putative hemolysin
MPQLAEHDPWARAPRQALVTELTSSPADVLACQRLRYRVFAEEMGARLPTADLAIDADGYDAFCRHLLVREADTGDVVASTRILVSDDAPAAGGFYSQSEFDLDALLNLPGRVMEVGRTCVRADYRTGWAINALWTGLARVMTRERFDFMIGCASVPFVPDDKAAHALLYQLYANHPSPPKYRVHPRQPVPAMPGASASPAPLPPLLKAYLRLGARICGEACWDPDFAVADVFICLDVRDVPARYRRHFLREPMLVS